MENEPIFTETPSTDPQTKFASGKENAGKAAEHLKTAANEFKDAASAKAHELKEAAAAKASELRAAAEARTGEFKEKATHAWEDSRVRARTLQEEGELYIRENPTKAVLTALAAGFFLGLIFRGK